MRIRMKTDEKRRALMQSVRRHGTPAEETVAALCRSLGLHYRRNVRTLPGSPDLANKSKRWAIFVNGCFWHHHTACRLATIPKKNRSFWRKKLADNRGRDARKVRQLRELGFRILIVWQCQVGEREALLTRLSNLREPHRINCG